MAGGSGTRLWPMSRAERPKQLLPMIGDASLMELTVTRLEGLIEPSRVLICTGERFRAHVRSALPAFEDEQILGEPEGRDTVNAIGLTAEVLRRRDADAVFAVLTSDHLIEPVDVFQRSMATGLALVEADARRVVTFSIKPTDAATCYGYVERGDPIVGFEDAYETRTFKEKPDRPTAESYLARGTFGWNSGMFVFHAATFMDALARFQPDAHAGLTEIGASWGTPQQNDVLARVYPTLPKISVDYAFMEPAASDPDLTICAVEMKLSWRDVGSWPSYAETLPKDADGNRHHGPAVHLDSKNVLTVSDDPSHTITTIGCKDLIVIRTADATLVCPASAAEQVKDLAQQVDEDLR
jgi:mannose-1-phosphate guanylyltransferase